MKNLQELKKEIQKQIPEIMVPDYKILVIEENVINLSQDIAKIENDTTEAMFLIARQRIKSEIDYIKETGRPINLEDVLRVMDKIKYQGKHCILIANTGAFWKYNEKEDDFNIQINCSWKLGKTLDQQSEETISFLHQLICQ